VYSKQHATTLLEKELAGAFIYLIISKDNKMPYNQTPFDGAPTVYGVQGTYTWGGLSSCGIDKNTQELSCAYTLTPDANLSFDPAYLETSAGVKDRRVGAPAAFNAGTAAGLAGSIKNRGAYYGA